MTTVSTSPVTLNDGSASLVRLGNTGTVAATVTWGPRSSVLGPGFTLDVHPNGFAVTAVTASGSTTLTVDLTGVPPSTGGGVSPETAAASFAPKSALYASGVDYIVGQLVVSSGTLYRVSTAHTSSGAINLSNFTAVGAGAGVDTSDVGYDVILAAGQSNMWGQNHATNVPDTVHYDPSDDRIYQYGQSGSFPNVISVAVEPLSHPVTGVTTPTGMGPAFVFARWYKLAARSNRNILIVPVAVGNTRLATDWDPVAPGSLYSNAITKANAAIAAAGANARLVAMLWLQGETDAILSYSAAAYQTKLDLLIAGWRAGITSATSSTPFILAGMVPEFVTGTAAAIRAVHAATPARVAYTAYTAGPSGMEQGDALHYTAAGQRVLGRSMFDGYLTSLANVLTPAVPGQVTGLSGTAGSGQVALTWTAPASVGVPALNDYLVEYKLSPSGTWLTFTDGVSTTAAATVTGLTDGSSYDFRVSAVNTTGTGTASATTSATPAAASAPGAPTSLSGAPAPGQVALTWTAPASNGGSAITDYIVQYRTTSGPGAWTTFSDGTSSSTGATVTGLTNATGYDFQVAAINAVGTGAYSTAASATPAVLSDTFTGTNGTLITAHTADSGGTWALKTGGGSATLTLNGSGKAVIGGSTASSSVWVNSSAPAATADYAVSADFVYSSTADAEVGVVARAASGGTQTFLFACQILSTSPAFCLIQRNAGATTVLGTLVIPSGGISTSETYRLTVGATGTAAFARCQRSADGFYLTSAGAWQAGVASYATGTTAVTAIGLAGLHTANSASNGTTVDNLSAV